MDGSAFYQQPGVLYQSPNQPAESGIWEKLAVYGGDVNDLAVHPNGSLFAAAYSGVYRSTDNGQTWEEVNTQLPTSTAISLAINSNGVVFVGKFSGLFKSTNNGDSWAQTSLNVSSFIEALVVTADDVLFAGAGAPGENLFRSTDDGNSWANVSLPVSTTVWRLFSPAPGRILAGTLQSGIYLSTDNGNQWAPTSLTSGIIGQFAINSAGEMFVGVYGLPGAPTTGVHHSADSGATWVKLQNEIENLRIPALTINSNDVLFAGDLDGGDAYRSTDNGATWEKIISGLDLDFGMRRLLVNANDDIFAGSVGSGIYRSGDGGDSWGTANQGLTGFRINGFAVSPAGDIFAAALPGSIFRSTNHGGEWEKVNTGLRDPLCFAVAVNSGGDVFTATLAGMYRSRDNGNTWSEINEGLSPSLVNTILVSPTNQDIYIGTANSGVYYSDNNGNSWRPHNEGLSDLFVSTLVSNANGDLFAGTQQQGIFRREPGSVSWTQINNGFPSQPPPLIHSIVVDPPSQQVFAAVLGNGVYRSQDNGDNWSATGLTNPSATSLAVDGEGNVFAGIGFFGVNFSNDVYRSTDGGNSWASIKSGIPANSPVVFLGVDTLDQLLAGTYSSGVVRWSNEPAFLHNRPTDIPAGFELRQNYPNPFNPSTTIQYSLPRATIVSLRIFNLFGQEVKTLIHTKQGAGLKSVVWDGTNNAGQPVASGIYVYRLKTSETRISKKLILMR